MSEDKAKEDRAQTQINDLPEQPLTPEQAEAAKGGQMGLGPGGGIRFPGYTLPVMTSDSSGNEVVDGT
jgi:hypothetical protein